MLMLFLEQAGGRPGTRGYHIGDPWCMQTNFIALENRAGSAKSSIIRATVFAKDNAANLALRDY